MGLHFIDERKSGGILFTGGLASVGSLEHATEETTKGGHGHGGGVEPPAASTDTLWWCLEKLGKETGHWVPTSIYPAGQGRSGP